LLLGLESRDTDQDRIKTRARPLDRLEHAADRPEAVRGIITGSVATSRRPASSIDLLAVDHRVLSRCQAPNRQTPRIRGGHAKMENLAAAIEGMLILVGAA